MLGSALAGILIALAAPWILHVLHRLWRASLALDAAEGIAAAERLGLHVEPAALRARLVGKGSWEGRAVEVQWRGGVRGAHSVVRGPAGRQRVPLIDDEVRLREALSLVSGS